jgi:hypothetical protein
MLGNATSMSVDRHCPLGFTSSFRVESHHEIQIPSPDSYNSAAVEILSIIVDLRRWSSREPIDLSGRRASH